MKKMIAILAVIALTASCFAANITITATTGPADTVTIGYSGGAPVGLSMKLTRTAGDATIANRAAINDAAGTHKVYIDYAYSNPGNAVNLNATTGIDSTGAAHPMALATAPGAAAIPQNFASPVALCMATLASPPTSGTLAVIKFTKGTTNSATFSLTADTANRGGIVDATGAAMTPTFPANFTVTFGTVCRGDVNNDHFIMAADIAGLVSLLNQAGAPYLITPASPLWNPRADVNGDGFIMAADISALVSKLNAAGPPYLVTCP